MPLKISLLMRLRTFLLVEWKLVVISSVVGTAFVAFVAHDVLSPESALEYRTGVIHDFDTKLGRHLYRGGPKATVIDLENNRFYRIEDRLGYFEGCRIGDRLEFAVKGRATGFTRGSCQRTLSPRGL